MRKVLSGALALLGLGCSGPDVSKFEGTWLALYASGTSSCSGEWLLYPITPDIVIHLREGEDSDLEWIDLDEAGQPMNDCIYRYSVEGDVATLDGRQTCVRTAGEGDTTRWTYTSDVLSLVEGELREEGEAVADYLLPDGTREACTETFHYVWTRLDGGGQADEASPLLSRLCEDKCDCTEDCGERGAAECVRSLAEAEESAASGGCTDQMDAALACIDDELVCHDKGVVVAGCSLVLEHLTFCAGPNVSRVVRDQFFLSP